MKNVSRLALLSAFAMPVADVAGQTIERVRPGDATLDCAGITQDAKPLDSVIASGDPNNGVVARSAASGVAGVGGQIGGSLLGSIFGPLGSVVGGAAGNAGARTATESKLAPDAAAQQRSAEAAARKDFLTKLATAKGCKPDDSSFAGNALSAEEFERIAGTLAAGQGLAKVTPFTLAAVTPILAEPVAAIPATGLFDGKIDLKGKRFYIAEFRVLFDVAGEVAASTRAGYLPGRDYGATRMKVTYKVPNVDVAALQAITDKAYADFLARAGSAGIKIEDSEAFVRDNGAVYDATEVPSTAAAPVILDKNGRKYLVLAPTGTKVLSRGFVGLGTGNMTKRMEWVRGNLDALSISIAVNVAALESSGNSSSILSRGSTANAKEGMFITQPPDGFFVHTHASTQALRMVKALPIEGSFAQFREVGGYDSSKDVVARAAGIISNLGGLGANQSKRVDMDVELDGPSTARMSLRGLASVNQAVVDHLKNGM